MCTHAPRRPARSRPCRPPRRSCRRGSASRARSARAIPTGTASRSARRRRRSRRPIRPDEDGDALGVRLAREELLGAAEASSSSVSPLNVLPSIAQPLSQLVARAEVQVGSTARCRGHQHDEVERMHRLDLEPAELRLADAYGASRAFTTTPSCPAARRRVECRLGLLGVVRPARGDHARGGYRRRERLGPRRERVAEQVGAVEVQEVEEQRREPALSACCGRAAPRSPGTAPAAVVAHRRARPPGPAGPAPA